MSMKEMRMEENINLINNNPNNSPLILMNPNREVIPFNPLLANPPNNISPILDLPPPILNDPPNNLNDHPPNNPNYIPELHRPPPNMLNHNHPPQHRNSMPPEINNASPILPNNNVNRVPSPPIPPPIPPPIVENPPIKVNQVVKKENPVKNNPPRKNNNNNNLRRGNASEQNIQIIISMGFTRRHAEIALDLSDNNVEVAVQLLLTDMPTIERNMRN